LTEHRIDALTREIRTYLPHASIGVLSAIQLAPITEKHPEILGNHYPAEIELIKSRLLAFHGTTETVEQRGLRLALIAFGSEDAVALRRTISTRAVLEVLRSYSRGASLQEIAEHLSGDLRLPKVLDAAYIAAVLDDATKAGLTISRSGMWLITALGQCEAEHVPAEAARELLNGRSVIRAQLESLTGIRMSEQQFETIWVTLLDFLSELFYSNGIAVIDAINEFLTAHETGKTENKSLERLLEEGAGRIRARMTIPGVAEDVEQGIRDIFTLHSGPAFEWLTRVCERFVALCALGLESSSAGEIRASLSRYQLVLDTDVVLTVLCAGEPGYVARRDLLARFRQNGVLRCLTWVAASDRVCLL
jgi:hypothetical protein